MDELTSLKLRIMALESRQRKTDAFLLAIGNYLKYTSIDKKLLIAIMKFQDNFDELNLK